MLTRPGERPLTIVNVCYPFAPVSADPVGGAEQVLARIDQALVAAGHHSIVIAPAGSATDGALWPIGVPEGPLDAKARAGVHAEVRARIAQAIEQERPDAIHLHGVDFSDYLPEPGLPVLVTLHLPLDWYAPEALHCDRRATFFYPVSKSQANLAPAGIRLQPPIENGVPLSDLVLPKQRFAAALGRICPEKGFDDAIDAAKRANVPLLLAGQLFPYPEHRRFFETRVLPRLDRARRWIGAVAGRRKQRLLARARCLLVPSKVAETSSLVAMEAIAAGTPVIAYRAGALPEIVEDGRTGFLVDGPDEMANAIRLVDTISPNECRARARERFPVERMTNAYLTRYREPGSR